MYPRLSNPLLSKSFFLFGARGTGKTRLLRDLFRDKSTLWIDLLKQGELLAFSRNSEELVNRLAGLATRPEWVVIDEIQRVPTLLNEVHALLESSDSTTRNLKFALTGSSARKLKRGASNLLAGRALLNNLYPLTYRELGQDFSLDAELNWGSLPAVISETDLAVRSEQLKSYVEVYLREEIREEQIVRRLDTFVRFLEVAAQCSGTIINMARIGREAGTDAKSVLRYFQILEDTLLGFFIEPFHLSVRKRQRQQAKFYLFDIGVRRALEGSLHVRTERQTYEWGRSFEQFIVLEAIRLNSYLRRDFRFSYLRTQSQLEVDLIAERKGERSWVIEIKSGEQPDIADIKKLKVLVEAIPNSRPALFCNAVQNKVIEGVEVLNWQEGFRRMFDFAPT